MSLKPIIIQNFFRSGGSYLYDLFNNKSETLGFYEPFHESLSSNERIKVEKDNFDKFKNKLSHTNKEFYFENFLTQLLNLCRLRPRQIDKHDVYQLL